MLALYATALSSTNTELLANGHAYVGPSPVPEFQKKQRTSIRFQNFVSCVEITAQLKRPDIGRDASYALLSLCFEILPS